MIDGLSVVSRSLQIAKSRLSEKLVGGVTWNDFRFKTYSSFAKFLATWRVVQAVPEVDLCLVNTFVVDVLADTVISGAARCYSVTSLFYCINIVFYRIFAAL